MPLFQVDLFMLRRNSAHCIVNLVNIQRLLHLNIVLNSYLAVPVLCEMPIIKELFVYVGDDN